MTELQAAAEQERHTLLMQAAREHASNMRNEIRRYEAELEQIECTYRLRTGGQD